MTDSRLGKTFLTWALVVLALGALLAVVLGIKDMGSEKYDIVVFGDSIIGNFQTDECTTALLARKSNHTVLNAGFGGTGITKLGYNDSFEQQMNVLSMESISKMVAAGDYSGLYQVCRKDDGSKPDYFYNTAQKISKTDFSKVKFVIIEQGINDFLCGVRIENENDLYDVASFAGALRNTIKNIKNGAKNAEIFVTTPVFAPIEYEDEDCTVLADFGGGTIEDYVEAVKRVSAECGVNVIDLYNESGLDVSLKEIYIDGLHPDVPSPELISDCMWSKIFEFENRNN